MSLDIVKYQLRKYQEKILTSIVNFFKEPENRYGKLAISSPTGTGKSVMQLSLVFQLVQLGLDSKKIHLITTRLSIILGYLKILGVDVDIMSANQLRKEASKRGIYTYGSYRNLLAKGKIAPPKVLIVDECHHLMPNNILTDDILFFMGHTKIIGFTATFQRATARATKRLHDSFDGHETAIKITEALNQGYWNMPEIITKGLIDDDVMKVSKGKFEIRSVEAEFTRLGIGLFSEILGTVKKYQTITGDAPCIVEVPSVEIAQNVTDFLNNGGVKASNITHKTPANERYEILHQLELGRVVLVQVSIVSEGFDLPDLAVYIDLKPKNSVVEFMQSFGRITRPSQKYAKKYYICFNRNISRHAYNFEGNILPSIIKEAQDAFEAPPKRQGGRIFGFESMGRFKPIPFTREDGVVGSFYLVDSMSKDVRSEKWAIILDPTKQEPIIAKRTDIRTGKKVDRIINGVTVTTDVIDYGTWERAEMPNESFEGFRTDKKRFNLSERQQSWWDSSAKSKGLSSCYQPNAREFQILPIMNDLKINLMKEGV